MERIRAWAVAIVALLAGSAIGVSSAALEATMRPWRVGGFSPTAGRNDATSPRAEADETTHSFGTIGAGAEGEHLFTIRNAGTAPLVLSRGATSCTCTVSGFEPGDSAHDGEAASAEKTVPPGAATSIRVTWRGKGPGGPFRQQATILTNDPRRPEIAFVVEGTVTPTWKAVPDMVTLPKLSAETGDTATVRVFTYGSQPPEIVTLDLEDESKRRFFRLESAPLAAADIAGETGATGGFRLTVAVAPGLPIGSLRETVRMVVRIPEEITAEVPVEGSVTGDLSFAGREWDSSRQFLFLGTVSSRIGMKTTLFLTARGSRREQVKPVVLDVVPPALAVTVGAGEPIGTGAVVRIPLEIAVPPGSLPANHLGSEQAPAGRIVLDTGLPDAVPLTIPVRVVIGP